MEEIEGEVGLKVGAECAYKAGQIMAIDIKLVLRRGAIRILYSINPDERW
jgi:hypothetical protein